MRRAIAGPGEKRRRLPSVWLFTDDRLGTEPMVLAAVAALPRGSGVVFRHYGMPLEARRKLLARIAPVARRHGHRLLVGKPWTGVAADGVHLPAFCHLPRHRRFGLVSAAAHSRRALAEAFATGADIVFLSPVFATGSHPGAPALGPVRFGLAGRGSRGPVVPLGGMTERRARRLAPLGAYGFAAVAAWRAASPSSTMLTSAESSKAKSTSPARAITSRAEGTT
jgi:thiamine-phosphate pyrophosphorylase